MTAFHPNLLGPPAPLDGDGDGVTLPLATGWSLAALVRRRGGLPAAEVLAVAAPLADALAALHAAGHVHRGVSPAAVLLTADGEPLLADAGGPGVVAPEAAAGAPPGPPADVHALGATCLAALAAPPPPALAASLVAATAADPAARPTAAALAEALRRAGPARRPVPPEDADVDGAVPPTVDLRLDPPRPRAAPAPSPVGPLAAAAAVAALLVAGAGAAWAATRADARPACPPTRQATCPGAKAVRSRLDPVPLIARDALARRP